ncbi:MAG: enoyl-CoA hydratase-related protein [Flavobacteriales bacterium]|jgi:2-(1,2-epoxy-1,2-dihydrophenyl)acetyl-CoA isomerase|nr:enoyl-CoA hydratase-related protein [Flavobacteriales bacterium]
MYENIKFEIKDSVAVITLNREKVLNSFNFEMADDVIDALNKCKDEAIRAVVFTGSGRGFCAGQDLEEATREGGPSIEEIVDHTYNPIVKLIRALEKPVIGGVNGIAAGAGANLALVCDITFASESSTFIQSFSNIGLVPDSGGTYTLPRLIGMQRATAMMFLGNKVSAQEAKDLGMIYNVVPDAELEQTVFDFAKKLASRPTVGLALTKQALNATFENSLEEQLGLEKELQAKAAKTYDHKESLTAFFEKRKPVYKGK